MNTGFQVCKILMALKLHFTSNSYNYFKYDGEVNMSLNAYAMRKDKYQCERLSRKNSVENKFVDFASTIYAHAEYPKKLWTSDFLTKDAENEYEESVKWTDSLTYNFTQELTTVMQSGVDAGFSYNWALNADDVPPLVSMLFKGNVSLEFCCILEQRLGMIEAWKTHEGDVFFDQFASRVERFRPFIMRRCFSNADITIISDCISTVVKKFK